MKFIKRSGLIILILAAIAAIYFQLKNNKEKQSDEVAVAGRTIESVPVKTNLAKQMNIDLAISSNGVLEANQQLTVVSETQGRILKINKQLGDFAQKGDALVKVDDETIAASVMVAEANVEQQEKDIERLKRMNEGDAITKHDLEKAEIGLKKAQADLISARKALSNTTITAPISGVINQKFVTEGQFLAGGMPVYELVDNSKLKLHVKIAGEDIYKIQKGQMINVSIPVFPNETFLGKISAVAVKADPSMKFDVEITLENRGKIELKSGLYAEVKFQVTTQEYLAIRKESITGSMKKPQVFVVENGKAILREIVTGISNDNFIEVISGLQPGEEVIYSGQLNLSGGESVNVIEKD